jgi:hypothetical protein
MHCHDYVLQRNDATDDREPCEWWLLWKRGFMLLSWRGRKKDDMEMMQCHMGGNMKPLNADKVKKSNWLRKRKLKAMSASS